jgi:hypothetical protein
MNILRNMSALVVGLLPLVISCAQLDLENDDEDVAQARQTEGGGGTHNGLNPVTSQACEPEILDAMTMRLVTSFNGVAKLNTALNVELKAGGACQEPLKYAYKCAGADGTSLPGNMFPGEELVTTATSWRNTVGGLSAAQQVDVLTCMTTLLNPTENIPICLEGLNVYDGPGCDAYEVPEAVWLAVPVGGAAPEVIHHVWPLTPGTFCPEGLLPAVLAQRVCANQNPSACSLLIHDPDDLEEDCPLQDGHHVCLGRPAIKTSLTTAGFLSMYAGCIQ